MDENRRHLRLAAALVTLALVGAACTSNATTDSAGDGDQRKPQARDVSEADFPEVKTGADPATSGTLPAENLTMKSVLEVDLELNTVKLPLHKGVVGGTTVWFVITDVSDRDLAEELGLNFAPRLANVTKNCVPCAQSVTSDRVLADGVEFLGKPDFSPTRLVKLGLGLPPAAVPGSEADLNYSPFVAIKGTDIVYDAPIVATGDGPFDIVAHDTTLDRVFAIDTDAMTVDFSFIRGFSGGEHIFYMSFESSAPLTATLERSTFAPVLGFTPSPDQGLEPESSRAALFNFLNGQVGPASPPAQGIPHVLMDGMASLDAGPQNPQLSEALRKGGDFHAVLDLFPTFDDRELADLYTPLWDVQFGVWSDAAVAEKLNTAQTDGNQIRQLAEQGLLTSPGGSPLASNREVVNCPVFGFASTAPKGPQAEKPATQP